MSNSFCTMLLSTNITILSFPMSCRSAVSAKILLPGVGLSAVVVDHASVRPYRTFCVKAGIVFSCFH